jgi:hypothetical protein
MATTKVTSSRKRRPAAAKRVEQVGPSRAALKRLVKKHRPPQSWYDENVDPFKPAK